MTIPFSDSSSQPPKLLDQLRDRIRSITTASVLSRLMCSASNDTPYFMGCATQMKWERLKLRLF